MVAAIFFTLDATFQKRAVSIKISPPPDKKTIVASSLLIVPHAEGDVCTDVLLLLSREEPYDLTGLGSQTERLVTAAAYQVIALALQKSPSRQELFAQPVLLGRGQPLRMLHPMTRDATRAASRKSAPAGCG